MLTTSVVPARLHIEMSGLLEIIEELKEEYGSINAAARAMGMPQATLHNLYKGKEQARIDTLRLIAAHRRQPLWKLVREIENRSRDTSADKVAV